MYSPKRTFHLADHISGFTKDSAFNFQLLSSVGILSLSSFHVLNLFQKLRQMCRIVFRKTGSFLEQL